MKRLSCILILSILSFNGFSQDLKKDIQGIWVCLEINDSHELPTEGPFGTSGFYLRFSFYDNLFTPSNFPFDSDLLSYQYELIKKDSLIKTFGLLGNGIVPEKISFKIKLLTKDRLILQTKNEKNEKINYIFTRQITDPIQFKDSILIDNGIIIIKHLKLSSDSNSFNRVYDYQIEMNSSLTFPIPGFCEEKTRSLGHYISNRFTFPTDFKIDSISPILTVEFYVSENGAENIEIIHGISENIDNQILDLLQESSKNWCPVGTNERIITIRNRFNFIFYLANMEYPSIFKTNE